MKEKYSKKDLVLFFAYAFFGIFMFFVPIEIAGKETIPIDHITSLVRLIPNYNLVFGVFIVIAGILYSIKNKSWQGSKLNMVFFVLKLSSLIFLLMYVTNIGPDRLFQADIIATGFSTVSATFMVIVASTLDLMDHWVSYFWITLIVTFAVTAITARIYPLANKPDVYFSGKAKVEEKKKDISLTDAMDEGMEAFKNADSLDQVVVSNFKNGFKMSLNIGPSLLGVGMLGLIIAEYTPIFDLIGYIFYPFTLLMRIPEPMLTAKALGLSIAEMLLPAPIVAGEGASIITRMLVAVVSVSEILFFSASIPCIMGTDIPFKFSDYIIIWIERVILSILVASPIIWILYG